MLKASLGFNLFSNCMPVFVASNISNKAGSLVLLLHCIELAIHATQMQKAVILLKGLWLADLVCGLKIKLFTNLVF